MSKEVIRLLIIWAPTILFLLTVLTGFVFGLIRGFRKSLILFIHMLIAGGICLGVFLWVVNDPNMEVTMFNTINNLLSNIGVGSIQSLVNVSESCSTFKELGVELVLNNLNSEDILYYIINDNVAYIYALIDIVYRLVIFIILAIAYVVLIFLLYLIYFIFYPVRRKIKKHNKKFAAGEVSHSYKRKRLLGGVVGLVRSTIVAVIGLSFLGALIFIVTGGENIPSREEITEDGEITFDDVNFSEYYDYYSYVCEMNDTGIFQVLNNIKDTDSIPFYFYISDLVLQGKINDENIDVEEKFYLRDELGFYVDFIKKAAVLLIKYDVIEVLEVDTQEEQMDLLIEAMGNPEFANEFSLLIDEFEAKPFMGNLALSVLTTVINRIELITDDKNVIALVKELFIEGEEKIKVSDLATTDDIKSLLKGIIEVVSTAANEIEPVQTKTSITTSEEENIELENSRKIIKYAQMLLPKIKGLSLFNENAEVGNKICKNLYMFCAEYILSDPNDESNTSNEVVVPNIDWIAEFNILFDATDSILEIVYYTYHTNNDIFIENLLNMFSIENSDKVEEAYDKLTGYMCQSNLLDEAFKLSAVSKAIDDIVIEMTKNEEAKIPHQYDFGGDDGECYKLLTSLKIFIKNDGYEIFKLMTESEDLSSESVKKLLDLLTLEVVVNDSSTTILNELLDSKLLHYSISSFLMYGDLGELEIYLAADALTEVVEGTDTYSIIKDAEIKNVVNTVVDCFDDFAPLIDGEEINYTKLLTNDKLVNAIKNSNLLKGTISNIIIDIAAEQDVIILPEGFDDPEKWLEDNSTADEMDYILEGIEALANVEDSDGNPLMDSLLEGNIDVNVLLDIEEQTIRTVTQSKVLRYTISNLITDLGSDGFEIVVPAASLAEKNAKTTKEDLTVNVVKSDEIVGIFTSVKTIASFDEDNNVTIKYNEIFNNKENILANKTLHATVIALIISLADEQDSFIVVPEQYRTDFEKIKTEEDLTGNSWFGTEISQDEMYKLIVAIETFVEKDPEGNIPDDFDFENMVEDAKITSESIDTLVSSIILNASISKIVASSVATPSEVYSDNETIEVSEYQALFNCLFKLLDKTTLTFDDFNNIDPNTLTLASDDTNSIKSSKIAMAMISDTLVTFEGIYIPNSVVEETPIVPKGEDDNLVDSVPVIKEAEFGNLIDALVELLGDKNETTNELEVSIGSIDVNNIKINKSKIAVIKSSEIIVSTVSSYLTDIEQVVIPVISTEETTLTNGEKIYVLKHDETEDELGDLLEFVIDLVGTGEGENREVTVSNIEFNTAKITEAHKDTILSSEILSSTISNTIITSLSSSLVIPEDVVVSKETCKKDDNGNLVYKNVLQNTSDKNELEGLLNLAFDLFGEVEEGNKVLVLDEINTEEIKITKEIAEDISKSDIINATVVDKLISIDSIIIPRTAISSSSNDYTGEKTAYLAKDTEIINLFDKLIDLLGTDGVIDATNISLDKEISLDSSLIENSSILSATISSKLIDVDSLVIPSASLDSDAKLYNEDDIDLIENSELKSLIDLIVEVLGEEDTTNNKKEFKINLSNPNIDADNIVIRKEIVDSNDSTTQVKLFDSEILHATVSKNIVEEDNLVIDVSNVENQSIYNQTDSSATVDIVTKEELELLFKGIYALINADKIELNNIASQMEDIELNSAIYEEMSKSNILNDTISNIILEMDTLKVNKEYIKDVVCVNGTKKVIDQTENDNFFDAVFILVGGTLNTSNFDSSNVKIKKENVSTITSSDIISDTISSELFNDDSNVKIPKEVVEAIEVYNLDNTINTIENNEFVNLLNSFFIFLGADEINVDNLNNTSYDTIKESQINGIFEGESTSKILTTTISSKLYNIEALEKISSVIEHVEIYEGSSINIINNDEIIKLFKVLFTTAGEAIDNDRKLTLGNITTDSINSPTTEEEISMFVDSYVISATISKIVLSDNEDVKVEINACTIEENSDGENVVVIGRDELEYLISGIIKIGGDFDAVDLSIDSILNGDIDADDFEIIAQSSIYRYLLTRELTKEPISGVCYYQLFTTENSSVEINGINYEYVEKSNTLYGIKDPKDAIVYEEFYNNTSTEVEVFTTEDIIALSKCSYNGVTN